MLGLSGPRPYHRPVRTRHAGRDRRGARDRARASPGGRRSRRSPDRTGRILPFRHAAKLAPAATDDPTISEIERERAQEFADKLTLGVLTRAWQILLKGIQDVKDSPRPLASAEMALIRLAYAADLPSPEDALRKLRRRRRRAASRAAACPGRRRRRALRCGSRRQSRLRLAPRRLRAAPLAPSMAPSARAFRGCRRARARQARHSVRPALEHDVRLARFEAGSIDFSLVEAPRPHWRRRCRAACRNGRASAGWSRLSRARQRRPCGRRRRRARPSASSGAAAHPLVQKVLDRFPGAQIVDVRRPRLRRRRRRTRRRRGRLCRSGVDSADDV